MLAGEPSSGSGHRSSTFEECPHLDSHLDANLAGAAETAAMLTEKGVKAVSVEADIATSGPAHAAFGKVVEALGRVDSMVNCAAVYPRSHCWRSPTSSGIWKTP